VFSEKDLSFVQREAKLFLWQCAVKKKMEGEKKEDHARLSFEM
jgi:hypothetical protein